MNNKVVPYIKAECFLEEYNIWETYYDYIRENGRMSYKKFVDTFYKKEYNRWKEDMRERRKARVKNAVEFAKVDAVGELKKLNTRIDTSFRRYLREKKLQKDYDEWKKHTVRKENRLKQALIKRLMEKTEDENEKKILQKKMYNAKDRLRYHWEL